MKKLIFIITCVIGLYGCDNKPEAPFGFKWGQSVEDVKKLSLPNFKVEGDPNLVQFVHVDGSPNKELDAERFFLVFEPNDGLTTITMQSKSVDKDGYYFKEGRELYQKLSLTLEDKYGPPKKIVEKVERDDVSFYFCLKEESCGVWKREYEKNGVTVVLEVEPSPGQFIDSMGKASISISYEYFTDEVNKK